MDAREDFIEIDGRLVADEGPHLRDIRNPSWHVLEADLIGLLVLYETPWLDVLPVLRLYPGGKLANG